MHKLINKLKRRRPGFTLIEVLAALAIIVVLTLALILMVKGQVEQANKKDNNLLEQTVNAQIEVQLDDTGMAKIGNVSKVSQLRDEGLVSSKQYDQLVSKKAKLKVDNGVPHVDIP
jgi:competence protein ComGC